MIPIDYQKKQSDIDNIAKQAAAAQQRAEENALMRISKLRSNVSLEEWKTLNEEEKDLLMVPSKGEGGVFNKQKSKDIEWAQWSWNPVTGCLHNCSYCLSGDTLILLADGRSVALKDLTVGEKNHRY